MPAHSGSVIGRFTLVFALGGGPSCALEPPALDEIDPAPVGDLGPADTWSALEAGQPPDDPDGDGPVEGSGPGSGAESGGGSTPDPAPVDPALAQLRLHEVLVDPDGKDGGQGSPEFVEILNPGPFPVDLSGLTIEATSWPMLDSADLGLEQAILEVDELLVIQRWATDVDPTAATTVRGDSVIWAGFLHSGGLRNTDGAIAITAGTMSIDHLEYGPTTSIDAPGSGLSMCRGVGPGPDPVPWSAWSACSPSPGVLDGSESATREPIPLGALVIVEVSANPPGPASEEKLFEYVEIINNSESPLELSGCQISDSTDPRAPGVDPLEYAFGDGGCESPTCLAPGFRALIVGQDYSGDAGSALVLMTDDTTIADGGLTNSEPILLRDPRGTTITSYRVWLDPLGEPQVVDEVPMHRIDVNAADEPGAWIAGPASPGE